MSDCGELGKSSITTVSLRGKTTNRTRRSMDYARSALTNDRSPRFDSRHLFKCHPRQTRATRKIYSAIYSRSLSLSLYFIFRRTTREIYSAKYSSSLSLSLSLFYFPARDAKNILREIFQICVSFSLSFPLAILFSDVPLSSSGK